MTRKGKYILAGIAASAVALAAAGAMAHRGNYWEGHKHRHMGGGGAGIMGLSFGGPNHRICRGDSAEFTDHMLVRLEHRVKPTDDQKAAFDEFSTAARAATAKLAEACPKPADTAEGGERQKRTPIERLAETQAGLESSLEALKTFRPAAEKFYAALSDEQKAKLDRGGRFGKGKGHWRHDRGPANERGPAPEAPAPDDKG